MSSRPPRNLSPRRASRPGEASARRAGATSLVGLALLALALSAVANGRSTVSGSSSTGTGPCSAALGCQVVEAGVFSCDNSSIAQALARSPLTEIRLVVGSHAENVAIADRDLRVIGGYASCEAARDGVRGAPGATSLINSGGSAQPTVNITAGSATPRLVVLDSVAITGTDGAAQGALRVVGLAGQGIGSMLHVQLLRARVHDNVATLGGGAYVRDALLQIIDSRIEGNEALQRGGGVYCLQGRVRLATVLAAVSDNRALTSGGGMHLDGCDASVHGGGGNYFSPAQRGGVLRNTVSIGSGGGIHASNGSYVEVGVNQNPGGLVANLDDNRANALDAGGDQGGGALFLTGAGTRANITNATLDGNSAGSATPAGGAQPSSGGAVYARDGATLEIVRAGTADAVCDPALVSGHYRGLCTRLVSNKANGPGGAVRGFNATLLIDGGYLTNNAARNGALIDVAGGGTLRLESSLLARNAGFLGENSLRHVVNVDAGQATLRSLTFTANEPTLSTIGQGIATVDIRGVLVDDMRWPAPPALGYDLSAPPIVACLQAHESASFPASAVRSQTGFANWSQAQRDALDVHLVNDAGGFSDMLDACTASELAGTGVVTPDADLQARGVDATDVPDLGTNAVFDVGLDEFVAIELFADGFESP
jgi:hypothetical protein